MFAIAFDLSTAATRRHHPRGMTQQAYEDIRTTLQPHGFERIQGSTYVADHEDQARLFGQAQFPIRSAHRRFTRLQVREFPQTRGRIHSDWKQAHLGYQLEAVVFRR